MITSKHGYVGTRKCVKYSGTHEELRDMLKEGDIVTLLWQNDDKSESIKITGTVTHCGLDSIDVRTSYDEEEYVLGHLPSGRCGLKFGGFDGVAGAVRVTSLRGGVD